MNAKQILSLLTGIVFIAIAVYLSIDLVEVSKKLIARIHIGWVSSTIVSRLLVCLSFGRGLQLILQVLTPKLKGVLTFFIGFIAGFGVSFISPIYESDYGIYDGEKLSIDHSGLSDLTDGAYQIKKEPYLVAFFTTTCSHCKEASGKIGFMSQLDRMIPVIAIFPGSEEDAQKFIKDNNGAFFEYHTIQDDEFFIENSDGSFPSIFLINEKGETVQHWFGDLLNYSALDYLESLKP